jgi:uncharacterized membrane protein
VFTYIFIIYLNIDFSQLENGNFPRSYIFDKEGYLTPNAYKEINNKILNIKKNSSFEFLFVLVNVFFFFFFIVIIFVLIYIYLLIFFIFFFFKKIISGETADSFARVFKFIFYFI